MQKKKQIPQSFTSESASNFQSQIPTTRYRFIHQKQVELGEAIYIVGNIPQLGEWKINCALRLDCYYFSHWIIDIDIPIDTQIQYKFFVSSFDHHLNNQWLNIQNNNWIGNQKGNNFRMIISNRQATKINETRKSKHLKVMSFNIRCQTKDDKDEFNWAQRKQNCVEIIKENYPSIIGIQEARRQQKPYLCSELQHLYSYVGAQRDDCLNTEEVGIFYDKQRFLVVEYDFKWISESRKRGVPGFGARLPRLYTHIILEDTYTSEKFVKVLQQKLQEVTTWILRSLMMAINVHLDHESGLARQKGVEMMAEQIQQKKKTLPDELKDIFVFGDFNTPQNPHVFHKFSQMEPCLLSTRCYFNHKNLRDLCDYKSTFNGFKKSESDVNNPQLVIDHLFIHTEMYKPIQFKVIREMIHKPKNPMYSIVSDHFPIMGVFKPRTSSNLIL